MCMSVHAVTRRIWTPSRRSGLIGRSTGAVVAYDAGWSARRIGAFRCGCSGLAKGIGLHGARGFQRHGEVALELSWS